MTQIPRACKDFEIWTEIWFWFTHFTRITKPNTTNYPQLHNEKLTSHPKWHEIPMTPFLSFTRDCQAGMVCDEENDAVITAMTSHKHMHKIISNFFFFEVRKTEEGVGSLPGGRARRKGRRRYCRRRPSRRRGLSRSESSTKCSGTRSSQVWGQGRRRRRRRRSLRGGRRCGRRSPRSLSRPWSSFRSFFSKKIEKFSWENERGNEGIFTLIYKDDWTFKLREIQKRG